MLVYHNNHVSVLCFFFRTNDNNPCITKYSKDCPDIYKAFLSNVLRVKMHTIATNESCVRQRIGNVTDFDPSNALGNKFNLCMEQFVAANGRS